jgi:hypothetical protein
MDDNRSNIEHRTSDVARRAAIETGIGALFAELDDKSAPGFGTFQGTGARVSRAKKVGIPRRVIAVAVAASLLAIGVAASRSRAAGPETARTEYLPSISDLMIATIQPRHERLWQAEQDKNWEFASYELGNLRGAFNRLGLAHPTLHDILFPEMIASVVERPLDELDNAIRAKDDKLFAKGYGDLTNACNSCHQALNHGVIKIRVPSRTSAADLDTEDK